ncbi:hypothetical protein OAC88_00190 [Flavobacteriaceae bacterium]|nr:hypothetical protein [Flavobacteriaceae bacterium]
MATLYDLAMQYLNQSLPKTFKYDRTNQPGTLPPITLPPQDPNAPTARILPVQGGGGDGFSVYNPDPNRTRDESNYNERPYKSTVYNDAFPMMGDPMANQATGALNADGLMSYAGDKPLEGIPGAAANYLKNSFVGKGLDALGNMMPVNQRAILENELLGQGFQLNDIGQFVSDGGDAYKEDGSNIMAGYNANKVTRQTFDKRRAKAEKNMTPEGFAKFNKALTAAEDKFFGGSGKATTVFNDQLKQKDIDDGFINDQISTYDEEDENFDPLDPLNLNTKTAPGFMNFYNPYERDNIVDVQRTKDAIEEARLRDLDAIDPNPNTPPTNYYVPDGTSGGGAGQGIDISNAGTQRNEGNNFQGDSGPSTQQESDYGYGSDFGFARGGIVNLRVKN